MLALSVTVFAEIASFRRPHDLNYQRTYLIPPPTTIAGLAGAALGLGELDLWARDSPVRQLRIAALSLSSPGRAEDTWTLMKFGHKRISGRSPYTRELLFHARYALIFGGDEGVLRRLGEALHDPVYPLTLGREDELAAIEAVELGDLPLGPPVFRGTVVPGDLTKTPFRLRLSPGTRIQLPLVVEKLPLAFTVDASGVRRPEPKVPLTFLASEYEVEVPGLREVWVFGGRSFTWMNS